MRNAPLLVLALVRERYRRESGLFVEPRLISVENCIGSFHGKAVAFNEPS
jgi:hypothetical protein